MELLETVHQGAQAIAQTFLVDLVGEGATAALLPGCISRAGDATLLTDSWVHPPATRPALSNQICGTQQQSAKSAG